ncbi:hypothetical protein HN803_04640 [candidate division WWE3 bacterium]|jgi:hypothetical protein|nr:hypothetical protein [Candidatus Scalindua sp.]MBT7350051.1 hypothetical protein [candidate division WWE3 bacterium]
MKIAVITVVLDDSYGVEEQKLLQAKTDAALRKTVESELPKLIKQFHIDSDFLEEEDDQYIADVVEDLMNDEDEVYAPSSYKGSGFVQVRYF